MTELVARIVVGEEERHLVLVEEGYAETGEPWTLFVNADHYAAGRRTVEQAYYWTLAAAQADCHDRFGVHLGDWVEAESVRFSQVFRFEYGVTNQGVPQPYPFGFEGGEVLIRLGEVQHPDVPPTPVLNVCGNRDGLRRLAALLLLCADGQRYDPAFHVHLAPEPEALGESPFFSGDVDVTLRAPSYLAALKDGSFREWSADVNLRDETDEDDEPWRSRPDA
jgi:hypothetical protein